MKNIVLGALWPILISLYRSSGREGFLRAMSIPEKELAKIQAKNHDSLAQALEKRERMVEGVADFVEELANLDDD